MSEIRNITLEILRHGPPHNQLLSPLTQYLALCGNHPSTTGAVPYEHAQFLARQQALQYEGELSEASSVSERAAARQRRELQLQITAQEMSDILANVPGLISDLKESDDDDRFTHFELVISASELALLPFELANAPNGFPGAGQSLTLQSQAPLCMTRRVRRVNNDSFQWPDRPRILFALNLPPDDRDALVNAHSLALRRSIDPWVARHKGDDERPGLPPRSVQEYMTVLENASVQAITDKLQQHNYTHLHILAHSVEHIEGVDRRFALKLADPANPRKDDCVSASRLATMVRSFRRDKGHQLTLPAVVTLACCNGANGGSVVGAGSSIAHALHEAGIPLVIASQFPLSFAGSVLLVDVIYRGLLWGEDPRTLLSDLRRQLKMQFPDTHDWASLIAYASFPADLPTQLEHVRYEQALRSIEAAFSYSDVDTLRLYESWDHTSRDKRRSLTTKESKEFSELDRRLSTAKDRLRELLRDRKIRQSQLPPEQLSQIYGRLGATEKRQAEIEFFRRPEDLAGQPIHRPRRQWQITVERARDYYREAFSVDRSQTWALVQCLALSVVVDFDRIVQTPEHDPTLPHELSTLRDDWQLAKLLSERDISDEDRITRSWAISNLIELQLLALWLPENESRPSRQEVEERYNSVRSELLILANDLERNVGEGDWEIISRRRQLRRYINWFYFGYMMYRDFIPFISYPDDIPCLIKGLAQELLEVLPQRGPNQDL